MTNSGGFGNGGSETICYEQIQHISSVSVTLNVQVIEVLIGSYHNIHVESWQFAQNGFISIDLELFIGIGNSIHLSYDRFVHAMSNFSKYRLKFEDMIYCEIST